MVIISQKKLSERYRQKIGRVEIQKKAFLHSHSYYSKIIIFNYTK